MSDQNEILLQALRSGPMTALEILDTLGIARASARVYDLRRAGHDVRSEMITVHNRRGEPCRVAAYSLAVQTAATPKAITSERMRAQ